MFSTTILAVSEQGVPLIVINASTVSNDTISESRSQQKSTYSSVSDSSCSSSSGSGSDSSSDSNCKSNRVRYVSSNQDIPTTAPSHVTITTSSTGTFSIDISRQSSGFSDLTISTFVDSVSNTSDHTYPKISNDDNNYDYKNDDGVYLDIMFLAKLLASIGMLLCR